MIEGKVSTKDMRQAIIEYVNGDYVMLLGLVDHWVNEEGKSLDSLIAFAARVVQLPPDLLSAEFQSLVVQ